MLDDKMDLDTKDIGDMLNTLQRNRKKLVTGEAKWLIDVIIDYYLYHKQNPKYLDSILDSHWRRIKVGGMFDGWGVDKESVTE